MPTIHIILDASGGLCLLHYATEIKTLTVCPAIYKMVISIIIIPPYTCLECTVKIYKKVQKPRLVGTNCFS